jgi:hypothetical protein
LRSTWITRVRACTVIFTFLIIVAFRKRHSGFFRPGVVFQCLNVTTSPSESPRVLGQAVSRFGIRMWIELRMFVVLHDNEDYSSTCL